jgi:hypothetical protein
VNVEDICASRPIRSPHCGQQFLTRGHGTLSLDEGSQNVELRSRQADLFVGHEHLSARDIDRQRAEHLSTRRICGGIVGHTLILPYYVVRL